MTHCGKWEYTFYPASTTRAPGDIKDALNDHGREGWELCITAQLQGGPYFILKRPLEES
jgi:hypothetical protein